MKANYIIGQEYGNGNTLLELLPNRGQYRWGRFRCKCGNEFSVRITAITSGNSKGCGCLEKEHRKTHGLSGTPLYDIHSNTIAKCYNTTHAKYKWYGARGITMSDEFRYDAKAFIDYISSLPNFDRREELKLELDRTNNNGNYERGNLRWATRLEQIHNRRDYKRGEAFHIVDE